MKWIISVTANTVLCVALAVSGRALASDAEAGKGSGHGVEVVTSPSSNPMSYVSISPCRLIDTRSSSTLGGAWGPPSLIPNAEGGPIAIDRSFAATGTAHCPGILVGARAIAAKVTASGFVANGRIETYPADASTRTGIATVNLRTPVPYTPALAQIYAIVPLDLTGSFRAFTNTATDLFLDVNGYYAETGTGKEPNPMQVALLRWYPANMSTSFAAGLRPNNMAFDGANIWVTNIGSNTVTKLRASDGAEQPGSPFAVLANPAGIVFDGANIWVSNSNSGAVTKLRASDGAEQPGSPFAVGLWPVGMAFDGANIWVANESSNTVSKL